MSHTGETWVSNSLGSCRFLLRIFFFSKLGGRFWRGQSRGLNGMVYMLTVLCDCCVVDFMKRVKGGTKSPGKELL